MLPLHCPRASCNPGSCTSAAPELVAPSSASAAPPPPLGAASAAERSSSATRCSCAFSSWAARMLASLTSDRKVAFARS